MIIDAREGKTTRDFRPFTDRGAIAHMLDSMRVGDGLSVSKFVGMKGEMPLAKLQNKISGAKAEDTVFRTWVSDGLLHIRRIA